MNIICVLIFGMLSPPCLFPNQVASMLVLNSSRVCLRSVWLVILFNGNPWRVTIHPRSLTLCSPYCHSPSSECNTPRRLYWHSGSVLYLMCSIAYGSYPSISHCTHISQHLTYYSILQPGTGERFRAPARGRSPLPCVSEGGGSQRRSPFASLAVGHASRFPLGGDRCHVLKAGVVSG